MEKYAEYKDSGVQWLGKIPSHWKSTSIKRVAIVGPNCKRKFEDSDWVGYAPMEKVRCDRMLPSKIQVGNLSTGLTYFEEGDVVLAKVTPCFENGNVAIVPPVENHCGYGSSELFVFRSGSQVLNRFLLYYFQNINFINAGAATMTGTGGLKRVSSSFVKNALIPVPSINEQQVIVSFLDSKTAEIDSYIQDKEREIELLAEAKQRIISDAVTKGLNKDVEMKESGIRWVPQIPKHWITMRAKYMFVKNKREVREVDEVITCFRDGQVTLRKNRRTTGFTESITELGYQGIRKGDLVIHQMDAFAGAIGVSDSDGKGTSVYHCCTPKGSYDTWYYAYVVRIMAHSGYIQSLYRGIRERSSDFNFKVFGEQNLFIPPYEEQLEIVSYVKNKTISIEKQISDYNDEILLLKDYKQRLISDVVTGQIKISYDDKYIAI